MLDNRYLRSRCKKGGWLHKFKVVDNFRGGLVERCERCGEKKFFPKDSPNIYYLQYHVREILKASDPLFKREYPNAL